MKFGKTKGKQLAFFESGKGDFPFISETINRSARFFSWIFITED